MTTQAEYLSLHDATNLTPEQMAELLSLPEGDTAPDAESGQPDPTPAPVAEKPAETAPETETTQPAAPNDAQAQVILAKDGVHTIPYEKLTEAREAEQHWKAQAKAAQDALAALQAQADARAEAGKAATATDKAVEAASAAIEAGADPDLFGDFSEEAIRAGVKKLVAEQAASLRESIRAELQQELAPIKQAKQVDEAEQARNLVLSKHPDAASIAESAELEQWVQSKPAFVRGAYQQVITGGTPAQVIELLDAFKSETGTRKTAATPDSAAVAQAAISKAQQRGPSSLSDIPGGTAGQHDENEAMRQMSAVDLMGKLEGKTPEQIADLMARLL